MPVCLAHAPPCLCAVLAKHVVIHPVAAVKDLFAQMLLNAALHNGCASFLDAAQTPQVNRQPTPTPIMGKGRTQAPNNSIFVLLSQAIRRTSSCCLESDTSALNPER